MILSETQIKSVLFGAVRTWREDNGFHACKCTEEEVAAWRALRPLLGERAETTSGIRLDFHTDATAVRFAFSMGDPVEVYINGVFRRQFHMKAIRESGEGCAEEAICDPLGHPLQDARVTVYFPSHNEKGVLSEIELVGATYVTPHRYDRKMLFIGDSITQGWAATHDACSYALRLSRMLNADSVVQGIGGGYFHGSVVGHLDFEPDIVITAFGTNDFEQCATTEIMRANAKAFFARIREEYEGKQLFAISPTWRQLREGKAMGSFEECRRVIIEEIEAHGLIHVDGLTLLPPALEYYNDGLHPNNDGFSLYAERLLIALQPYL